MGEYDSRVDTYKHIQQVQKYLMKCVQELQQRLLEHDQTKLEDPEKKIFDEYSPKLEDSTYGSDEYNQFLDEMQEALVHHYAHNDHHPEHFDEGIQGMDLIQLLELAADWMAATKRHNDGDILESIEKNQERFGYGDELKNILRNTVINYFDVEDE